MLRKLPLGSTGIEVSPLGLGTVKFGRNQQVKYPSTFELPTDAEVRSLLALAQDLGINLLDTAPAYGHSEERIGRLLGSKRQEWVIVTKAGEEFVNGESLYNFTPEHIKLSITRSLDRLKTDYLDVVLIHSSGDDLEIINNHGVFSVLQDFKQAGIIRAYGMSTKTIAGGIAAIEQADVAMVTYNPAYKHELAVLDRALVLKKGILIKKAFASGHLEQIAAENPIQAAVDFIFQHKAVSSIIAGTINPEHLRQNVAAVEKAGH